MVATISELIWLHGLSSLDVSIQRPALLYCDNQAALQIVANLVFHE